MKKRLKMAMRSGGAGFTLIEGVLAIAFIGIGLVGVLFVYQGAANSSLLADQTVTATNIARETLEKIVAKRDVDGYAATLTAINGGTYNANPVSGFPIYVLTTTALEIDPDDDNTTDDFLDALPGSGYARVTALVSWNNGGSSIRLVSLMANY